MINLTEQRRILTMLTLPKVKMKTFAVIININITFLA
jgi:hypothetical protein